MGRVKTNRSQQKSFLVFLETPSGGIKNVTVRAMDDDTAARRAAKRNKGCKVHRVERGI